MFTIYVDSILRKLEQIGKHTVLPSGFCDDIGFISATSNLLYKGIKVIKDETEKLHLTISMKKTKILALYPPQYKSRNKLRIGEKVLGFEVVDRLKYLGLVFNKGRNHS